MNILVTGGAGYLGSKLIPALLAKGHAVSVFDSLLYGGQGLLPVATHKNFSFSRGDVRDAYGIRQALDGCHAVIHLAALVGEPVCKQVGDVETFAVNTEATRGLVEEARSRGMHVVFTSTCSNYGSSEGLATEDAPLTPLSTYAQSKVKAEYECSGQTVLRLGTLCGLSTRMRFDLLVNEFAQRVATGKPLSVYAANAWRPYLHIDDAVDALISAVEHEIVGTYNIVGENFTKQQLIDIAQQLYKNTSITVEAKGDDRNYRVDGSKWNARGTAPSRSIASAFTEVVNAVQNEFMMGTTSNV